MTGSRPDGAPGPHPRADFPYAAHPTGWFQVGWSEELTAGAVMPLKYFDQDLVCYRGHSGRIQVLDAFCPHMGAHLGYGGEVTGDDCITCPFHGWEWSATGQNVNIPYSTRINRAQGLRSWPVEEHSGCIYVWYDAQARPPRWDAPTIPEVGDDAWYPIWPDAVRCYRSARLLPQFVVENTVDLAHLKYVHKWEEIPEEGLVDDEGDRFRSTFHGKVPTSKGPADVEIQVEVWGMGVIVSRLVGLLPTVQILSITPVDREHSDVRLSALVRRPPESQVGEEAPNYVKAIVRAQVEDEWKNDAPIWEHQRYVARAPFSAEEARGFMALRRWAERFYPA